MKKALYVDFDGTLTKDHYWRTLPHKTYVEIQEVMFGEDQSFVQDWMRGKHTAEEANEFVANHIGIPYDALWEVFVTDCETMFVPKELLESINALRTKYCVVLVTGNMDTFSRYTAPALQLENYFDHIINSYYEKRHKTDDDGGLFSELAERFDTVLEESILIDDNQHCCDVFTALGGVAYRTKGPLDTATILQSL